MKSTLTNLHPGGPLIRLKDFAELISQSSRTVYRMIDAGTLPRPYKQGRKNYFHESDLARYLQQLESQRS